nr:hypothetical protein [Streptomyces hygroscopicus]
MIDAPVLPEVLAEPAAGRANEMDADTVDRELSIAHKAIGRWQRKGWIACDPTIGIERRPAPPDRTKALAENQIAALWRLDGALREMTFWKMFYESAAWADEELCLNVEDLYPQDKRGRITAKGGATEWIHWQSGTAQLLPRLIARRSRGPLFLTDRKAPWLMSSTTPSATRKSAGLLKLQVENGRSCSVGLDLAIFLISRRSGRVKVFGRPPGSRRGFGKPINFSIHPHSPLS